MSESATNPDCSECVSLVAQYQSATAEQARVHRTLAAAERDGNRGALRRLTLEAFEATSRRSAARVILEHHRRTAHFEPSARRGEFDTEEQGVRSRKAWGSPGPSSMRSPRG